MLDHGGRRPDPTMYQDGNEFITMQSRQFALDEFEICERTSTAYDQAHTILLNSRFVVISFVPT
jgi:hypothetical protein